VAPCAHHNIAMSTDVQDLVVIGGGTSGIAAARFYLEVHPEAKVTIVERDGAVGGVWSRGKKALNCLH
jgi:dimethylaniline monooxygenase (N-oxide forming)